jgi:hypothetical protein
VIRSRYDLFLLLRAAYDREDVDALADLLGMASTAGDRAWLLRYLRTASLGAAAMQPDAEFTDRLFTLLHREAAT